MTMPQEEKKQVVRSPSFLGLDFEKLLRLVRSDSKDDSRQDALQNMTEATRKSIQENRSKPSYSTSKHSTSNGACASATSQEKSNNPLIDETSESSHDLPSPTSSPRRNWGKRHSSVSFLDDVSVCQLEAPSLSAEESWYSKEEIHQFKLDKEKEDEEAKQKEAERKKLAKKRAREERRKRIQERRASRSADLTHMQTSLRPQTTRRHSSSRNLGSLASFLDQDKHRRSSVEKAEEDRDALSYFDD